MTNDDLEKIMELEKHQEYKLNTGGERYYRSQQAKTDAKRLSDLIKKYLKQHSDDYLTTGCILLNHAAYYQDEASLNEIQMFTLAGKGKFHEDQEEYENAIEYYSQANELFFKIYGDELEYNKRVYNDGAEYGEQVTEKRLRICKNKLFKKEINEMESEAKKLEKTNPSDAIKLYDKLNNLKPGLKKYNKRIEICKKKL